jgi:hypothetical protein
MRKAVLVALTLLVATFAAAQTTTYTYTGDPYTVVTPPYVVGGQMTGSFSVASPLPAFLPSTDITPSLTALSFNDGVETRTLANSFICTFKVATDGAGNITQWEILLRRSPYNPGDPHHSIQSTGLPGVIQGSDQGGTGTAPASPCGGMALTTSGSSSTQGSWTDTFAQPSVPTTYNYTGDPYNAATAPYTVGGQLTGSVTFANPLPPFLPFTNVTTALTSLSFDDGVETRTLANSFICSFQVATDGAGNITRWQILLRRSPYNPGDPHHSIESSGEPGLIQGTDLAGTGTAPAAPCDSMLLTSSGSTSSQGTWTDTNPLASQPTTYNYTGDPYTFATAPYAIGGQLTGSITVANPLPPFLPLTDITPALTALSFNDGVAVRTFASSFICSFQVATDGAGNITQWQFTLRQSPYTTGNPQHSIDSSGQPGVIQGIDLVGTGIAGANPCDPFVLSPNAGTASQGTWTDTNPLSSTPATYNYIGDPFTTALAPYAVGGSVTGSITVGNALPPFLPLTDITPSITSLSFTDGVATRTLANSFICSFRVATDGAGNITEWEITLRQSPYSPGNPQHSIDSTGVPGIIEGNDLAGTGLAGANPCDPIVLSSFGGTASEGTWIAAAASAATIPALDGIALALLAAFLALAGWKFAAR